MPKKCIKFISEYLIPNLNNKRFGERLKWIDESKSIFELEWRHKSGPKWTEEEASVFVEWDKHKGHFEPGDKQYFTKSKQRFRSLLYKLTQEGQLKKMKADTKFKKVYCIGQKKSKKRKSQLNAEYESCNEDETVSEEQECEYPDATYCREVFKDDIVNVLEDHSYSVHNSSPENYSDLLQHDVENEQVTSIQDLCIPITSSELSDNIQKRILMERNSVNISTLIPVIPHNSFTENFQSLEYLRTMPENTTMSISAEKLLVDPCLPVSSNTFVSENFLAELFKEWPNVEMSELIQMDTFDQNNEEAKYV